MEEADREEDSSAEDTTQKYRQRLVKAYQAQLDQWDKTILWMASGALAISLAFVKDIVRPEQMTAVGWLFSGWVFLALALLCTLASFYTSALSNWRMIKRIDSRKSLSRSSPEWANIATHCMTPISGVLLLAGLAGLIGFSYINLDRTASQKQKPTEKIYGKRDEQTAGKGDKQTAPANGTPAIGAPSAPVAGTNRDNATSTNGSGAGGKTTQGNR